MMKLNLNIIRATFCFLIINSSAFAEPYIYPSKGQSQEQTESDKYQCYGWAKQTSGFDPMHAPTQYSSGSQASQGSVVGGAARGAAGGAIIGAIAGDAGKGAAIGAAAGGVTRGLRNRGAREQQYNAEQQQAAQLAHLQSEYDRAFAVCMEGRGYSVK